MQTLVGLRDKCKDIYGRYSTVVMIIVKFLVSLCIFLWLNQTLAGLELLGNVFVLLILALLCSILPWNMTVLISCLVMLGHCYGIAPVAAGFGLVLLFLLFILYLRFTPEDGMLLTLTPVAFGLSIPAAIPLGYGLRKGAAAALSASCGVIIYAFVDLVSSNTAQFQDEEAALTDHLRFLLDGMLQNRTMYLEMIAFLLVLLFVSAVRKLSAPYARQYALIFGSVLYIVVMVAGGTILGADVALVPVLTGTLFSFLLMEIMEFFVFHVDYKATEYLQYEDDEYVYYVKAVPKVIAAKHPAAPRQGADYAQQEGNVETMTNIDYESRLEESLKDL